MRKIYICLHFVILLVLAAASDVSAQSCVATTPQTFTNSTAQAIPTGPGVITSTITVSGAPTYLYDLNLQTFIQHTFNADLDITIMSPSGRVVTLTTDNGGGNDDVFNGTVWDDNANPGGQVPYSSNNGLVTDQVYTNLVTATPLAPEEPLGSFIGENPNGVWTLTISDDLAGDGGSLNSWSMTIKGLNVTPTLATFNFTNSTVTPLVDVGVITSTITVSGAGTQIQDVNLQTFLTHTFNADLDFTLTSPAGTVVTISTDNGGSNDNVFNGTVWDDQSNPGGQVPYTSNNGLVTDAVYTNLVTQTPLTPEEPLSAFVGENPNGVWTLTVSDDLGGDIGTLNSWGLAIKTSTCLAPCTGTPAAGTISGTTQACFGNAVNLTLSGMSTDAGVTYQWQSAAAAAGPFSNIAGATSTTYSTTASGVTTYYQVVVTCSGSGIVSTTPVFTVTQGKPVHSNVLATVTSSCAPGSATITGTVSGGNPGNYTHTLTGPGTIVQNAPSGANNSNCSFTVTNIPAGSNVYTLTSIDAFGCSVVSNASVQVNPVPVVTITPSAPVICRNVITPITANSSVPIQMTVGGTGAVQIPGGQPGVSSGVANPYPANIVVSGFPTAGVTVKSVKIFNFNHSFSGDVDMVLVSPTGTPVILMSDCGSAPATGQDFTFDDAAGLNMSAAGANPSGTYLPTNYGTPDNFPAPGPGSLTQATPTLASIGAINPNGTWSLYVVDDATGDFGFISNWNITFNVPSQVVFSPTTGLFTDAAATIPYTGTPINTVYTQLTANQTYTATSTVNGCTGQATVNVTVNQPPTITTQPTPASQIVCPGFNVTYSVAASGTGLTYQWRKGGVALANGGQISGATTNSLTITNVSSANTGSYDVVVTGTCSPAATSSAVTLTVGTAPTITTAPANASACVGANTSFTVTPAGTPGAPFLYQWQVSTDAGVTWTNIGAGGNLQTLTLTGVVATMNGYRYRVIVTNNCGQNVTSASATLTINPTPAVTITPLPATICLSDTLVNLNATPIGGNWSGIGVSGFNFVPGATAVGTYTLTYSYTSNLGCLGTGTVIAKVSDCPERERLMRDNGILLFPNPNNGLFYLKVNSTLYNYMGIRVYNQIGQLVSYKTYNSLVYNRVVPVDLRRLPAGVYNVRVFYDDGARTDSKMFHVVVAGH